MTRTNRSAVWFLQNSIVQNAGCMDDSAQRPPSLTGCDEASDVPGPGDVRLNDLHGGAPSAQLLQQGYVRGRRGWPAPTDAAAIHQVTTSFRQRSSASVMR